ncbi:MAG: sugar phosphate nucleotidyltransferase [Promethearchaeota archaeon]
MPEENVGSVPLVLLTAGMGTRMRPLTHQIPKCLLPVLDVPISTLIVDSFKSMGVRDVFVVVNPSDAEMVRKTLGETDGGVDLTFVLQRDPRGMADALIQVKSYIERKYDSFIVSAADVKFPRELVREMVEFHLREDPDITLSLMESDDEGIAAGHGNVKLVDGIEVVDVIEKPKPSEILSAFYSPPVYIFKSTFFDYLEETPVSPRGELELQDAIKLAIGDGKRVVGRSIVGEKITTENIGKYHLTSPRDFFLMNVDAIRAPTQVLNERGIFPTVLGKVWVDAEAIVDDSNLLGPNVVISKAEVGHYTEISNSIVMSGANVGKNCRIKNSILGIGVKIPDGANLTDLVVFLDEEDKQREERLNK